VPGGSFTLNFPSRSVRTVFPWPTISTPSSMIGARLFFSITVPEIVPVSPAGGSSAVAVPSVEPSRIAMKTFRNKPTRNGPIGGLHLRGGS
jgi:hypothetical protein